MVDEENLTKLAVLVHADVVGSTELVRLNETLAHQRIRDAFQRLSEVVGAHGGIAHEIRGDALVAEFSKASDAVSASIAFQEANAAHNNCLEGDVRPQIRIGIAIGEVVVADNTLTGEGVVLAQRLEQLTDAGGVSIQGAVYDTLPKRLPFKYRNMGETTVKGFSEPVRVYSVSTPPGEQVRIKTANPSSSSDKPSIAVLPFTNMSGDPEQEYFSDGITEDIITALSHFRELLVIARNTTFSFKNKPTRVDQICKELNIKYVLEGSVRKAGDRIRVTAQLIAGESGTHIWAERYDRDLDDVFLVQDEITGAIVTAVAPRTMTAEVDRAHSKASGHLSSWDRVMQARWHVNRITKADSEIAHALLDEAIAASPELPEAYATKAECLINDVLHIWRDDAETAINEAVDAARRAVSLDPQDANGLAVLGSVLLWAREFDEAYEYLCRALRVNPNLANAYGVMAAWHGLNGNYEQSCEAADKALEISPLDSSRPLWFAGRGIAAYIHEDYELVIEIAQRLLREHPGFASAFRQLAASYAMLERDEAARAAAAMVLERMPSTTITKVRHIVPVRGREAHERWLEGLRKAGLPE